MLKEFKKFAIRGNFIDMSVGILIAGAFGKIITSLVNDVIMPLLSIPIGQQIDFTKLFISLNGTHYESLEAAKAVGAPTLNYGSFITTIVDFLIIALCIFIFVQKLMGNERKKQKAAATIKTCPYCKTDINIEATRCPNCTSQLAEKVLKQ